MKIIWTDATEAQLLKDTPKLLEIHERALKSDPTWAFFGGTITIGEHSYQIA